MQGESGPWPQDNPPAMLDTDAPSFECRTKYIIIIHTFARTEKLKDKMGAQTVLCLYTKLWMSERLLEFQFPI